MATPQNEITARQSLETNRRLLRARDRNYRAAKWMQGIQVALSIALPVTGVLLAPHVPWIRPYIALSALLLLFLEAAIFDRMQKERLKRGAKLQEQFDTEVFGIDWNRFVAGSPVEPEDVRSLSARPLSKDREQHFEAWYEPSVGRLPVHLARLVCQRTNISYDARLRRKYGGHLLFWTISLGVILLFFGLRTELTFSDLLVTLLVPIMPVLTWALRERTQQANAAASLVNLGTEWQKIWTKALSGASPDVISTDSRALQDAIYQHRERSPLVFDWVYYRLRPANEDEARHAAEELVEAAESAMRKSIRS